MPRNKRKKLAQLSRKLTTTTVEEVSLLTVNQKTKKLPQKMKNKAKKWPKKEKNVILTSVYTSLETSFYLEKHLILSLTYFTLNKQTNKKFNFLNFDIT